MVKKIFLLACLFSLLFTVPALAASSKAKLLTDTSSSANTVPYINAAPAEDSTAATALGVQLNGTEMMRVTATGSVGIGTTTPRDYLDVGAKTTSLILPTGTTGQRPTTGVAGMMRFNSTIAAFEGYNGSSWSSLSTATAAPQLTANASAPATCSSSSDGTLALTSNYTICVCRNGTGWVATTDGSSDCPWYALIMVSQSAGSTIGNMTGGGGLASAFDGVTSQAFGVGAHQNSWSVMGYVGKDWGSGITRIIRRVVAYGQSDYGFAKAGSSITLTIQGSNDNSSWTTLLADSFTDAAGLTKSYTSTNGLVITTGYRYHRVTLLNNTAGTDVVKIAEVQFYQ